MKTSPSAKDVVLAQCVDVLRFKHYSLATEKTYCGHIGSYIDWLLKHGSALPDSRARVEAFLTGMAHRGCSASTQNQAFNALLFLYEQVRKEKLPEIQSLRAKASKHKRTALSRAQTHALLAGVEDQAGYPTRLVTLLLYGCGMRVSEPLNLRIKDLDTSAWIGKLTCPWRCRDCWRVNTPKHRIPGRGSGCSRVTPPARIHARGKWCAGECTRRTCSGR